MWQTWIVLSVSCALVGCAPAGEVGTGATTRAPLRTLDREASELAWQTWLHSPESGSQNTTHRRITTKSLFITPLICPKGQQLHRDSCIQVVTVNKDEHERNLLHELNALFTAAPNHGDIVYDYGDEEQGPFQLSIPIGLDPQAATSQELNAQAQNLQANYVNFDKKGDKLPNTGASIEAELELLKLQQENSKLNITSSQANTLSHNVLNNLLSYSDKPKRDSPSMNDTTSESNSADKGQEEVFFGQVNIDPVLYDTPNQDGKDVIDPEPENKDGNENMFLSNNKEQATAEKSTETRNESSAIQNTTAAQSLPNTTMHPLKSDDAQTKLSPENEYSDIGEAIKLISRYADVSTDDIFNKEHKKETTTEDSVLGTRTKIQYRRNRPKPLDDHKESNAEPSENYNTKTKPADNTRLNNVVYYRYPWQSKNSATPPPHYPFKHLQDYWPGRNYVGGVYNSMHGNPRRHHHSFTHYVHPRNSANPVQTQTGLAPQEPYTDYRRYHHDIANRAINLRPRQNNQDLYSLLGLRHWIGSEEASKR